MDQLVSWQAKFYVIVVWNHILQTEVLVAAEIITILCVMFCCHSCSFRVAAKCTYNILALFLGFLIRVRFNVLWYIL